MRHYRTWLADSRRWDGFEFRAGDIVISTPSKCGTTWMQMICALLVFRDPELPRPLTELSPWLDIQTDTAANVQVTGTVHTTCTAGSPPSPTEQVSATLVVVKTDRGWRVDLRLI